MPADKAAEVGRKPAAARGCVRNSGTEDDPEYLTVSDIVAVNDHEFLVDERDGKGLGDDSLHPEGVDNPNVFFVFAVDPADLPGYVPQAFSNRR